MDGDNDSNAINNTYNTMSLKMQMNDEIPNCCASISRHPF